MSFIQNVVAYFTSDGPYWDHPTVARDCAPPLPMQTSAMEDFGPGIGNQPDHWSLLRESVGIADACTRAIANRVGTLVPVIKRRAPTRQGFRVEDVRSDHPFQELMFRPHPDISQAQLFRLLAQWIVTVGEAYVQKVRNGIGCPGQLNPIPPARITPLIRNNETFAYKVWLGDGEIIELPKNLFVRMFFLDPENIWGSEGYLGPAAVKFDALQYANAQMRSFYKNDATPKSTLEAQENATEWTQEQRDQFAKEWRQIYDQQRGSKMGIPAIIPTGYKLVQMGIQTGADISPLLEHWRDDMLMHFGVPKSVLGQVTSGDRSSAETTEWTFEKHTIQPIALLIAESVNLQLAGDFEGNVFLTFDDYVTKDKQFILQQEISDLDRDVKSINEVREERGLDPVDWGDEPRRIQNESGNSPVQGQQPVNPENEVSEDERALLRAEVARNRKAYRASVRKLKRLQA